MGLSGDQNWLKPDSHFYTQSLEIERTVINLHMNTVQEYKENVTSRVNKQKWSPGVGSGSFLSVPQTAEVRCTRTVWFGQHIKGHQSQPQHSWIVSLISMEQQQISKHNTQIYRKTIRKCIQSQVLRSQSTREKTCCGKP